MASELEFVNYKQFVESLPVRSSVKSSDKNVVCNSTDGLGSQSEVSRAQKIVADNLADEFDPNRTSENRYVMGEYVSNQGEVYRFKFGHYGAWNPSRVEKVITFDEIKKCALEADLELVNGVPVYYPLSQYAMGTTSSSGAYQPSSTTRVTTPESLVASETFTIFMASGYRCIVYVNHGDTWTSSGWQTKVVVEKGSTYKVMAGRIDDSGVVTVNEVVPKIKRINSVDDLGGYTRANIERLDFLLENVSPKDVKPDCHFVLGSLNTSTGDIQENGHRISMDVRAKFTRNVKISHDFEHFSLGYIPYDEGNEVYKSWSGWFTAPFEIPAGVPFQIMIRHIPTEDYNVITPIKNDDIYKDLSIEFGNEIVSTTYLDEVCHIGNSMDYDVPDYVKGLVGSVTDFRMNSTTKVNDIYAYFDNLMNVFPSLITRETIGTSTTPTGAWAEIDDSTYPIYCYTIKCSASADKTILLSGGIHGASENGDPIEGIVACAYFVRDLMFNRQRNQYMQYIHDNCVLKIVPLINPWGVQNDQRGNGNGVDCNRNFDINFVPNQSSLDGTTSGTSAFSENETIAMRDLLADNTDAVYYVDIHSRMNETIPGDTRWLTNSTDADLTSLLVLTCNKMIEIYGGSRSNSTTTSSTASSTAPSYAGFVKGIKSYTCEYFRSNNLSIASLDTVWVELQCVNWFAIQMQKIVEHYCIND